MLKIRRPLGRLIFNMGIAIPGKTVFLIETAPWALQVGRLCWIVVTTRATGGVELLSSQLKFQELKLLELVEQPAWKEILSGTVELQSWMLRINQCRCTSLLKKFWKHSHIQTLRTKPNMTLFYPNCINILCCGETLYMKFLFPIVQNRRNMRAVTYPWQWEIEIINTSFD